jgi:hypothetical protein
MNSIVRFFKYFDLRCYPLLACSRHGRCWIHQYDENIFFPPETYAGTKELCSETGFFIGKRRV